MSIGWWWWWRREEERTREGEGEVEDEPVAMTTQFFLSPVFPALSIVLREASSSSSLKDHHQKGKTKRWKGKKEEKR